MKSLRLDLLWKWILYWRLLIFLLLIISTIWCCFLPLNCFNERWRALSALFSGLAFAAIFWTIFKQHDDENVQKVKERFFHLLNAWQNIAINIEYHPPKNNPTLKGIGAFLKMEHILLDDCLPKREKQEDKERPLEKKQIAQAFNKFYEEHAGAPLGYIFRINYQVVKFIDDDQVLSHEEKKQLVAVFRALLSDPELHLLLYFGLSDYAEKDFYEIINRYDLLDGLTFKPKHTMDRIPEICFYKNTHTKWLARLENK